MDEFKCKLFEDAQSDSNRVSLQRRDEIKELKNLKTELKQLMKDAQEKLASTETRIKDSFQKQLENINQTFRGQMQQMENQQKEFRETSKTVSKRQEQQLNQRLEELRVRGQSIGIILLISILN